MLYLFFSRTYCIRYCLSISSWAESKLQTCFSHTTILNYDVAVFAFSESTHIPRWTHKIQKYRVFIILRNRLIWLFQLCLIIVALSSDILVEFDQGCRLLVQQSRLRWVPKRPQLSMLLDQTSPSMVYWPTPLTVRTMSPKISSRYAIASQRDHSERLLDWSRAAATRSVSTCFDILLSFLLGGRRRCHLRYCRHCLGRTQGRQIHFQEFDI